MSEESETKVSNKFQSSDMLKSLDHLVDETMQILEFNSEEENVIGEICETIGMMLTQLKSTVKISPALLGPSNVVKRAVLGQDGRITITYSDDEVLYRKLTDFRPSMLMLILNDLFPRLKDTMADYRKTIEERLTVYRTARKKLKKIETVLKQEQKASMEDSMEEELHSNLSTMR